MVARNIVKFVLGAAGIVLGAQLLIDNGSAHRVRCWVCPTPSSAATMIAIGTSLPELVTTLTAIRKRQSSLSVGNIIGANIMDLTLILPLCSLILGKPLPVQSQGMLLDIPACLIICAAVLVPALWKGKFQRWMGFLAGGLYIVYLDRDVHLLRRVTGGVLDICRNLCYNRNQPFHPDVTKASLSPSEGGRKGHFACSS